MGEGTSIRQDAVDLLYGPKCFSGRISSGNQSTSCELTLGVNGDGSVKIILGDLLLSNENRFLLEAGNITTTFPIFFVEAINADGDRLSSQDVYFTQPSIIATPEGTCIRYMGSCLNGKILIKTETDDGSGSIRYFLQGFRCAFIIQLQTPFGELTIGGTSGENISRVGGMLHLKTTSQAIANEDTRGELIDFLEHIIWLLSFASDIMIRDPAREFRYNGVLEIHLRNMNEPSKPNYPPFSHINLLPILTCIVAAYSTRRQECFELRMAIEMMLIPSTYTEPKIINMIAAFENLINKYLDPKEKLQISDDRFNNILQSLPFILVSSNLSLKDQKFVLRQIIDSNWLSLEVKLTRILNK